MAFRSERGHRAKVGVAGSVGRVHWSCGVSRHPNPNRSGLLVNPVFLPEDGKSTACLPVKADEQMCSRSLSAVVRELEECESGPSLRQHVVQLTGAKPTQSLPSTVFPVVWIRMQLLHSVHEQARHSGCDGRMSAEDQS